MDSKDQNKTPSISSQSMNKRRRIEKTKMQLNTVTRSNARPTFSVVNGGQEQHPTGGLPDISCSDCGVTEFTKEDADALLNERLRVKNNFNYKEKNEKLVDHNRRLKQCIRWYQTREGTYVTEQDKLKSLLESAEKKCSDMESMMKAKEDELDTIIIELRKKFEALQRNFAKGEVDKLEALDSLTREKDSRLAAEELQVSLSEDLKRTQQDNASTNQKIQLLNDTYKRLQEYNTSLQQYNSRLQSDLHVTNDAFKCVEQEKASVVVKLSTLRGQHISLQGQLTSSQVSRDGVIKKKETDLHVNEVACLRGDLHLIRDDCDRQLSQVQTFSAEVVKYKECTEKIISGLDKLTIKTNAFESTCMSQSEQIRQLRDQLASAEKKLQGFLAV